MFSSFPFRCVVTKMQFVLETQARMFHVHVLVVMNGFWRNILILMTHCMRLALRLHCKFHLYASSREFRVGKFFSTTHYDATEW